MVVHPACFPITDCEERQNVTRGRLQHLILPSSERVLFEISVIKSCSETELQTNWFALEFNTKPAWYFNIWLFDGGTAVSRFDVNITIEQNIMIELGTNKTKTRGLQTWTWVRTCMSAELWCEVSHDYHTKNSSCTTKSEKLQIRIS